MNSAKNKRCAVYIRVSTEEQHLNGLSLPAQQKALTDYANQHGYSIIDVYADEGISARKSMKNRKELLRLLEDVKRDKIDMILVTKLDRWFRNIKDYNITEEILQAHNCNWKTIFENYDSSTANGQMVINIMLSVNQAECDRTSERIKAVFDYKKSQGKVISGMAAPYGYVVVDGYIQKDPEVSHIIYDAYDYYFKCFSQRKVIEYIRDKYGDKAPSVYKLDKLFKNEKYAGKFKDNYNFCEPYIPLEHFNRIRSISQTKTYSKKHEHTFIFSSLLRCPICNSSLTGCLKRHKHKNGTVSTYYRYRCANKLNGHYGGPCITEHVVENYMIENVFEILRKEYFEFDVKNKSARKRKNTSRKIEEEISRLNSMFQKGRITEDFYDSEYERLQADLSKSTDKSTLAVIERYSELLGAFSGNWLDMYSRLDNEHKNVFWKSIIEYIYFDENNKLSGFKFLI